MDMTLSLIFLQMVQPRMPGIKSGTLLLGGKKERGVEREYAEARKCPL